MFCKILCSLARLPYRLRRSIGKRWHNWILYWLVYNRLGHYNNYERGSARWFQAAEKHFGGHTGDVKFDKSSGGSGVAWGGDRMFVNNYAKHYAKHLARFSNEKNLTIVECGILRGHGLAMWSVLFPQAKIIGMDIDPSNFKENINFLKSKGAFQTSEPKIIQFDQLAPITEELKNYLGENKIDIFIDDGMHTNESIMKTLQVIYPLLNKENLCFIEDNPDVFAEIKKAYPNSSVTSYGALTVIENK